MYVVPCWKKTYVKAAITHNEIIESIANALVYFITYVTLH